MVAIHSFQMLNDNLGYLVSSGSVNKTTNGGVNWHFKFLMVMAIPSVYILLMRILVMLPGFKTTNGGSSWYSQVVDILSFLVIKQHKFYQSSGGQVLLLEVMEVPFLKLPIGFGVQ